MREIKKIKKLKKIALSLIVLGMGFFLENAEAKSLKSHRNITLPVQEDCDGSNYLTGDWDGARCALLDEGVDLEGSYTMNTLGDFLGGKSRGVDYADALDISANLDLSKLLNWRGAEFFISAVQVDGKNIGTEKVGSVFSPMEIYTGNGFLFENIYLKQNIFNPSSFLKLGRINPSDDFMTHPIYDQFVSAAINANPGSVFFNTPFTSDSDSEWGLFGQTQAGSFVTKAGVYNTVQDTNQVKYHGLQMSFNNNDGAFIDLEEDYLISNNSFDLPAEYSLGGLYVTGNNQVNYQTGQKVSGNYGAYIQLVQQFTRPNGLLSTQGLSGFLTVIGFPSDRNPFPFFGEMGLTDQGLLEYRPMDVLGLAYFYGKFGNHYSDYQASLGNPNQSYEGAIEINYKIQLTNWGYLEPDFQWVQNPGGANQYHDAWVAGVQAGVVF